VERVQEKEPVPEGIFSVRQGKAEGPNGQLNQNENKNGNKERNKNSIRIRVE